MINQFFLLGSGLFLKGNVSVSMHYENEEKTKMSFKMSKLL